MIITCEQCLARFRLADDKIKPGGTRVRCSKCQSVFTVMPPLAAAPEETAATPGEVGIPPAPAQQAVAPPPREPAVPPVESHGPVEFDFGFSEPGTAPPAVSDDAPVPSPLPSTGTVPPPTDATDSADQFLFAAIPPDDLPDAAPDEQTGTTATNAAIAEFTGSATVEADRPAAGLAEGTDEDEDRFVFSEAAEPAEPVESFSFDQTVGTAAVDGSAAACEFAVDEGGADRAAADFAGGTDEDEDQFVFAEEPETAEPTEIATLDQVESEEPSPFDIAAVFGEEEELAWGQATETEAFSFDFDEPNLAASNEQALSRSAEGGLGFGEINFGDQPPEIAPGPAPAQAAPPLAASPATPPPVPPPPRPSVRPPQAQELAPTSAPTRKSPLTRLLLLLALLLLLLCGAGGYFYFASEGQQFAEQLMLKLKGEEAAPVVEQRIGLSIADSSYVDNREVGQLLVIQGATTNNFGEVRSAITVKGVLLNADGKVLQQQTVFGGNYLSEEKLREIPYAQIEEAMNNQFGDSLTNMNVKPGATIRFTIVFRNPPQDLAGINVEVVDSKPGGL